jgi:hypothetical protein
MMDKGKDGSPPTTCGDDRMKGAAKELIVEEGSSFS